MQNKSIRSISTGIYIKTKLEIYFSDLLVKRSIPIDINDTETQLSTLINIK